MQMVNQQLEPEVALIKTNLGAQQSDEVLSWVEGANWWLHPIPVLAYTIIDTVDQRLRVFDQSDEFTLG